MLLISCLSLESECAVFTELAIGVTLDTAGCAALKPRNINLKLQKEVLGLIWSQLILNSFSINHSVTSTLEITYIGGGEEVLGFFL